MGYEKPRSVKTGIFVGWLPFLLPTIQCQRGQTEHCINCAYTLQQTIIAVLLLLFMLSVTVEIGLLTCEIFTVS